MNDAQLNRLKDMNKQLRLARDQGKQAESSYISLRNEYDKLADQLGANTLQLDKNERAQRKSNDTVKKATTILGKMSNVATHAGNAIGGVADAAYAGARGYGKLKDSITSGLESLKEGGGLLNEFIPTDYIEKVPLLGEAFNETLGIVGGVGTAAIDIGQDVIKLADSITKAVDKTTAGHRKQVRSIFDVGKQYGSSVKDAEEFTSSMRKAASTNFSKSMYLGVQDFQQVMQGIRGTSLTLDDMSESVNIGSDSMKAFNAVAAQQKALGMGSYYHRLGAAVKKQGMTMQESMETFAAFGDISKKSGIDIDQVANTLMNTANNFAKLGMSADFGRPLLEGFTDSLGDMGLGVENALSLTSSLSNALGKLTEDYGLAYLTFQRGGLEIGGATGGGGMLNTSIQLQAEMLEAEKTGDQSKISSQMVKGMRDTIASFTGGDIVTVKDAAEDSSLQNAFYMQQQMLSSQYGISGADATRTLEMFSKLDEANAKGDIDTAKKLTEQINNQKEADDKTLSIQEKMGIGIAASAASLEEQSIMMKMSIRKNYDEMAAQKLIKAIEAGGEAAERALGSEDKEKILKNSREKMGDLWSSYANKENGAIKDAAASAKKRANEKNMADAQAALNKKLDAGGKGKVEKGGDLKTALDKLVAYLEKPQRLTVSFSDNAKDILQIAKDARAAKGSSK
jgi:hypothetical protein